MYLPRWPTLSLSDLLRPNGRKEFPFPLNARNKSYFYVARSGIYHLIRALGYGNGETVLMPDYHSGVEVWAVRAAGASVRYYHMRRNLEPDLDEIRELSKSNARVLYLIHYFGWPQPVQEMRELCRERGMLLIEDCALSMLSEADGQPLGTFGDYSIFCLYKTLPVPNGGLLVQNGNASVGLKELELQRCGRISTAARVAELMFEGMRSRSNVVGSVLLSAKRGVGKSLTSLGVKRLPVGDITPDFQSAGYDVGKLNIGMSPICNALLNRFDYQSIHHKRRQNYLLLQERLESRVPLLRRDLEKGMCPLFFPLLVPDKDSAAQALQQRGIGAVELWNYGYPEAQKETFPDAQYLRDHVLELPIHQDITPSQVEYMAEQVLSLKLPF